MALVPPPHRGEPPFRWLFLDMNAYFASCEQQARPELRGKPVAVAPILTDSGACIAASYPAKRCGVRTGTRVTEARRLCPGITIVPARPELYVKYHHRILDAVGTITPIHQVRSIDEMSIRLCPSERTQEVAVRLAMAIKQAVYSQAGEALLCSVGLAPNEFLAKMATDLNKPDGLTMLPATEIPERLLKLKITDFPGISSRMEQRFQQRGISTVAEMYEASAEHLHAIWGSVLGSRWWYQIRGYEMPEIVTKRRSVGHSNVLPPVFRNVVGVRAVFLRLIQKGSARLRAMKMRARALQIFVHGRGQSWDTVARFDPANDPITLVEIFHKLWERKNFSGPVRIGIQFFELVEERDIARSLFDQSNKLHALGGAMDAINQKFGKNTVYIAAGQSANDTAEEKIAFVKTTLFDEGAPAQPELRARAAAARERRMGRR